MLIKDLQGKNIIIWGMGTEGQAVKNYFNKHNLTQNLYEYNDSDGVEKLEELAKVSLGNMVVIQGTRAHNKKETSTCKQ